jgi:hypothetical protein
MSMPSRNTDKYSIPPDFLVGTSYTTSTNTGTCTTQRDDELVFVGTGSTEHVHYSRFEY